MLTAPRGAALCSLAALLGVGCGGDMQPTELGVDHADAAVQLEDAQAGPVAGHSPDAARADAAATDMRDAEPNQTGAGGAARSQGCGKAQSGGGTFARHDLHVGDRDRTYYVRVPDGYDKQRAYPAVFRWHGTGGDGLSGGLGIEYVAGDGAFVLAADGLDARWGASTEENDLLLFDAMYEQLNRDYCVDLERVFSYGFSAGAGMTNMLGCKRGDKLRGSAAIAGYLWGAGDDCSAPVAAWFLHDLEDPVVPVERGRAARDLVVERNGCAGTTTELVGGCISYDGCKAGYPVVWCETRGLGHNIAGDTAPAQVWDFFSSLP